MVDNEATFLLQRTTYKLYCCVGLGPLMLTYILIVPDQSCVEVSPVHMCRPNLSVVWETKFLPDQNCHDRPLRSSHGCVDITIDSIAVGQ